MIKDHLIAKYASWVTGTIELNDPDVALQLIKNTRFDGNEEEYLSQLAMTSESAYFTLIARLVHTFGDDHPAVQFIVKEYNHDFADPIKQSVNGKEFYPLDIFIALGITGKALLAATIKTHEAFAKRGDDYHYGLHRELADFINRGQATKHQVEMTIDRFYNHYCVFGNTIANNNRMWTHLKNLNINVTELSSNMSLDDFIDLYKDQSENGEVAKTDNHVKAQLPSNYSGTGDVRLSDLLGNNTALVNFSPSTISPTKVARPQSENPPHSRSRDPLESIEDNRVLQKGLAEQLAKYKYRQQFQIAAEVAGASFDTKPKRRHLIFSGPPGTGKTTLAGDIGEFFYHLGFLSKGHVHKTTATKLTGEFVGQTMPKVQDAVRKALGGVLFIDEVYHWADDEDGYGADAINELLEQMETHRANLIVVVAGYKGKIEKLLRMNDGLAERFGTEFQFNHFSRNELSQILDLNLGAMKLKMADDAKNIFIDYLEARKETEGGIFANARTLENLLEQTIDERAVRWNNSAPPIIVSLTNSFPSDDLLLLNEDDVNSAITVKERNKPEETYGMGFGRKLRRDMT